SRGGNRCHDPGRHHPGCHSPDHRLRGGTGAASEGGRPRTARPRATPRSPRARGPSSPRRPARRDHRDRRGATGPALTSVVKTGGPARFRGVFRQDVEATALYSESAGIHRIAPTAVAVPVDAEDLSVLVDWVRSEGAMLVPRGSGSSM